MTEILKLPNFAPNTSFAFSINLDIKLLEQMNQHSF